MMNQNQHINKGTPKPHIIPHPNAGFNNRFTNCQVYTFIEFFAGTGNLTTVMASAGYRTARFDLMDNQPPTTRRSNYMDLTSVSGFLFFGLHWISTITIIVFPIYLHPHGLCPCSGWPPWPWCARSRMTLPTTWAWNAHRGVKWMLEHHGGVLVHHMDMSHTPQFHYPMFSWKGEGLEWNLCTWMFITTFILEKINLIKKYKILFTHACINDIPWPLYFLFARSCLMILLATALGGAWSLEQPSGSLAEYHPSFREMLRNIFDIGGPTAVWVPMLSIELYCQLALFMCLLFGMLIGIRNQDLGTISTVVDVPLLGAYTKAPLCIWEFQNHSKDWQGHFAGMEEKSWP